MQRRLTLLASLIFSHFAATAQTCPASGPLPDYPLSRTVNQQDTYHGTTVADPYRWLEDVTGERALAWVRERNADSESRLHATPGFESETLLSYELGVRGRLTSNLGYDVALYRMQYDKLRAIVPIGVACSITPGCWRSAPTRRQPSTLQHRRSSACWQPSRHVSHDPRSGAHAARWPQAAPERRSH